MSFTSDIWSDPSSNASLLSLICHGIVSDFERSSIILKCETLTTATQNVFESKDALNLYINDSEIDPILPEEWKIIECCVELLKPFEEATRELSSSHTHLISDSDNSMLTRNYLTASPESPIYHAAKTLKAGISGKFSTLLEEENSYIIATYLDPRYKNKFFTSLTEEKIKDDILKISRNTEDIFLEQYLQVPKERRK
ncbi:Zinc finger BED domain-containing protein 4 [Eumeta japonica]|uniref:Zinc finger BED domain-containing protein 4 n=1 Tax=Eumeta variegata TaxID=151549 RepID=A0A4C1Y851_EUMVA|nr:Zinc finger BED domain-containing protein 4 [Eumeta japonica]